MQKCAIAAMHAHGHLPAVFSNKQHKELPYLPWRHPFWGSLLHMRVFNKKTVAKKLQTQVQVM